MKTLRNFHARRFSNPAQLALTHLGYVFVASLAILLMFGCAKDATTSISTPPVSVSPPSGTPMPVPASDPIVVNAERTLSVARDTFRFIAHEERQNQAAFAKASPAIHGFVENIRRNGVGWLRTAEVMKTAYKSNRSPANKANLLTAISTVSTALDESKKYLSQAGYGAKP